MEKFGSGIPDPQHCCTGIIKFSGKMYRKVVLTNLRCLIGRVARVRSVGGVGVAGEHLRVDGGAAGAEKAASTAARCGLRGTGPRLQLGAEGGNAHLAAGRTWAGRGAGRQATATTPG
jgi:hypothetical protein